jgi:NO-binding membrane sensor protein with MHYT domain
MHTSYDYGLVSLSVVLAIFASYAALELAGRVASSRGRLRALWLYCGAIVMGLGIWAMHYVGMLALNMPITVSYHLPTVALSLLAAIAASAVALFVVSRPQISLWQEISGSIVMGSGIAGMHYVGMAAVRCSAVIVYDPPVVALSIVLAVIVSFVALRLAFRVRDEKHLTRRKIISTLVMGSAIPLMHYTGMWAASFRPSVIVPNLAYSVGISTIGLRQRSPSPLLTASLTRKDLISTRHANANCISIPSQRPCPKLYGPPPPTARTTTSTKGASTLPGQRSSKCVAWAGKK